MWTVKRNHDSPLRRLAPAWEPQSMLSCNAAALWRSPDWRWTVGGILTRKSNPAVLEKVIHDFVHRLLNDRDKMKFEYFRLLESFDENVNEFFSSSSFLSQIFQIAPVCKESVHEPTQCERLEGAGSRLQLFLNISLEFAAQTWSLRGTRTFAKNRLWKTVEKASLEIKQSSHKFIEATWRFHWLQLPTSSSGTTLVHLGPGEKGTSQGFKLLNLND